MHNGDYNKHVEYCHWYMVVISANGKDILDITFYADEVWFLLSGQDSCVWSVNNQHQRDHGIGLI